VAENWVAIDSHAQASAVDDELAIFAALFNDDSMLCRYSELVQSWLGRSSSWSGVI
jgi:hypothetical protein